MSHDSASSTVIIVKERTEEPSGMVGGDLTVKILNDGIHSGAATGIVPSSFRIARMLLSRVEDEKTGVILPKSLYVDIPAKRIQQAKSCAEALGALVGSIV
jgi:hypothetical protein